MDALNRPALRRAVHPTVPHRPARPLPAPTPGAQPCATCADLGWVRYDVPCGDPRFGQTRPCPACRTGNEQLLRRCRAFSRIDWDAPDPPTLEGFDQHDADAARMWDAAVQFATAPTRWLTIHGRGTGWREPGAGHWGAGKSHLGEAIARTLLARRVPTVYQTADALFQYAGACWRDEDINYDARLRWLISVPVLVVDELGKESASEATARVRFEIFNERYQQALAGTGGATVLLSNDQPTAWADPAIASRACDNRFVVVEATAVDYRRVVAQQEVA